MDHLLFASFSGAWAKDAWGNQLGLLAIEPVMAEYNVLPLDS